MGGDRPIGDDVGDGAWQLERERRLDALERRYRRWIRRAGVLTELGGRLADRFDRELGRLEGEARR